MFSSRKWRFTQYWSFWVENQNFTYNEVFESKSKISSMNFRVENRNFNTNGIFESKIMILPNKFLGNNDFDGSFRKRTKKKSNSLNLISFKIKTFAENFSNGKTGSIKVLFENLVYWKLRLPLSRNLKSDLEKAKMNLRKIICDEKLINKIYESLIMRPVRQKFPKS